MKNLFLKLFITAFVLIAILPSCHFSEGKIDETKDKLSESRENAAEAKDSLEQSEKDSLAKEQNILEGEWEKFKTESENKIDDNDRSLAKLKAGIANRHSMKDEYQKAIDNIQRKNESLKTRLADFKDHKTEPLNSFKQRFNNDINEVAKSLENIK